MIPINFSLKNPLLVNLSLIIILIMGILSWQGRQNIDSNVGECLQNNSLEIYYHVPSLCQHFSMTSAIYPDKPMPAIGLRSAIDFVGEH